MTTDTTRTTICICSVSVLFGLHSACAQAFAPHNAYSPDRLPLGSVINPGADGWIKHAASSAPTYNELVVRASNGGRGHVFVGMSDQGVSAMRKNDPGYAFRQLQAGEVFASMMDVRVGSGEGNHGLYFGLAADGSSDEDTLADEINEVGPQFGIGLASLSGRPLAFRVREAGHGPATEVPVNTLVSGGEWIRLKFTVNLLDGTGSLQQRNLSRHAPSFTPVQGLQRVPLGLGRMDAGAGPTSWDHLYLRVDSDTENPLENSDWLDNLVPIASDFPLPSVGFIQFDADLRPFIYTFEGLSPGSLTSPSQDGWRRDIQYTSSQDLRVVTASSSTHVVGDSPIGVAVFRTNDGVFSFPPVDTGRPLTTYADVLARTTDAGINAIFSLGRDVDADGAIRSNENGPAFGMLKNVDNLSRSLSFLIRAAANGAITYAPAAGLVGDGDWVRLRFVQDFSAGKGTLSYMNLSRLQTSYTEVLTGVDLALSALQNPASPANWNAMCLRMDSVSFGASGSFAMGIDNLVPNADSHPFEEFDASRPEALLAEDLVPGISYHLVHRTALGSPGTRVTSFRAGTDSHVLPLPTDANGPGHFYSIETDVPLAE